MSEDGMFASDRCEFCGEFGPKAAPWLCPACEESVRERVRAAVLAERERCARIVEDYASDGFGNILSLSTSRSVAAAIRSVPEEETRP